MLHVGPNLPAYRSHKKVYALKIKLIRMAADGHSFTCELIPEDEKYAPFTVTEGFYKKHCPYGGGYFVVYEDGYQSFSPAEAFEGGYTLITEASKPTVHTVVLCSRQSIDDFWVEGVFTSHVEAYKARDKQNAVQGVHAWTEEHVIDATR